MNTLINSSLFILAWFNIGAQNVAIDEGKKIINCKEATIDRSKMLKEMNLGESGWSRHFPHTNIERVSDRCSLDYSVLVTRLEKDKYMFQMKGAKCDRIRQLGFECYKIRILK